MLLDALEAAETESVETEAEIEAASLRRLDEADTSCNNKLKCARI